MEGRDETSVSISKYWKLYSRVECIVNIRESMHELRSTALNGCYNIWPEAHEDFYGYPNQQDKNMEDSPVYK